MNIESNPPRLELIFRALSDRVRLRLLLLLEDGELCVGDLVSALDLPQANVSRHLAYLQRAGLVAQRAQGLWRFYRLDGRDCPALLSECLHLRPALEEAAVDRQHLLELRRSGQSCCPSNQGMCA